MSRPTLDLMSGHCSICGEGRIGTTVDIVRVQHPAAPMVPAAGKPGHPTRCKCKPCVRMAVDAGEVPQWYGFCRDCAALIGGFEFPVSKLAREGGP